MQRGPAGAVVVRVVGPAVRRLRREAQWRTFRRLRTGPVQSCPHQVATHATPLFRELAGLDPDLQCGKVTNLRLAADRIDALVLPPGGRFSFWRHVGRPAARRGFVPGLVLDHGRFTAGTGGGMCQLTNLLYWLTLHTPLTVVERWRHSYDVFPDAGRTQPFGSGATCAWPSLDLQVRNDTTTTFRLSVQVTDTELRGAWSSSEPVLTRYEIYEAHHRITNDAPGVFMRRNVVRRRTLDGAGEVVADELVAANQGLLMYAPFLESGR